MTKPNPISRRGFIKGAAVAAGAAITGFPNIVASTALGDAQRPAASNRITLGLIGVGGRGTQHLHGFCSYPQAQVVAVCDVLESRREARRQDVDEDYAQWGRAGYKGCAAYNDFREILARPDIDAVVISTPPHWHSVMVAMAAKAGKDIYSEKPFSLTIKDGRAMVETVRRNGRVFQHGTQWRTWPHSRRAAEIVRSGRLGKLTHAQVCGRLPSGFHVDFPAQGVPKGLDWDLWLGPAPWRPYNGEFAVGSGAGEMGGGWLGDLGSHMFDMFLWWADMEHSAPTEIIPPTREEPRMQWKFANGFSIYLDPSKDGSPMMIYGSEGHLECHNRQPPLATFPESIGATPLGPKDAQLYACKDFRLDWLEAIRTRQDPFCPVEVGCNSASIHQTGEIACLLDRPLKWDAQKAEFIGDEQANRRLDWPKRAPWQV